MHLVRHALLGGMALLSGLATAAALPNCASAIAQLPPEVLRNINRKEVLEMVQSLNRQQQLPDQFIQKRAAQEAGWRPGRSLWAVPELRGMSIGGDRFYNRSKALPSGTWFEADLDYQGERRRNAKRMVYNPKQRQQFITLDHYTTFTGVPACR